KEISVDELANVVDDDADGGDDNDDIPISQVIRMKKACRRRLKPLKKCVSKSGDDKTPSCIPTNDDAHDDVESEEDLSESEEGNLNDFIVDDFDVSNCEVTSSKSEDEGCNGDVDDSDLQDVSDEEIDIDFGKDPLLCMKAVCVINREQIAKEQMYKYTEPFCYSGRGFNKVDAARGNTLAWFITDGNPQGDIKKTVKELKEYNSKGVKICKLLAKRYWKQLYFQEECGSLFPLTSAATAVEEMGRPGLLARSDVELNNL
ncbi:transcriptional regulator ATRX, partial [Trifolium medium]|nr:transcriptional regulator ATRX [Trifolium medium]